jgi:hypothetical protein
MTPEEYKDWLHYRWDGVTGLEYIKEFFMPEDLEAYIRERNYYKTDWDDPTDWVNGVSIGLSFQYREHLPDTYAEAKFRIEVALFLIHLIRRMEWDE